MPLLSALASDLNSAILLTLINCLIRCTDSVQPSLKDAFTNTPLVFSLRLLPEHGSGLNDELGLRSIYRFSVLPLSYNSQELSAGTKHSTVCSA